MADNSSKNVEFAFVDKSMLHIDSTYQRDLVLYQKEASSWAARIEKLEGKKA